MAFLLLSPPLLPVLPKHLLWPSFFPSNPLVKSFLLYHTCDCCQPLSPSLAQQNAINPLSEPAWLQADGNAQEASFEELPAICNPQFPLYPTEFQIPSAISSSPAPPEQIPRSPGMHQNLWDIGQLCSLGIHPAPQKIVLQKGKMLIIPRLHNGIPAEHNRHMVQGIPITDIVIYLFSQRHFLHLFPCARIIKFLYIPPYGRHFRDRKSVV